ncbi:MAG: RNA polymerase sigma factor [Planctomycetes bacterium]|nr:RNA polymerase sigma factor [Planctomycetota bacterium]
MTETRAERLQAWFAEEAMFLYCWFRSRLGPVALQDFEIEDLMQDVWVRAMSNDGTDGVTNARAWLLAIARNVVLEVLRAVGRRQRIAVKADGLGADVAEEITTMTRRIAREEVRQRFFAELDGLDGDDRNLLVQLGLEGRPVTQVAGRMGLSVDAAHKRWQRLRQRLRTLGAPADLL